MNNSTAKLEIIPVENEMNCMNHATSGFRIIRLINGETAEIELTSQELYNAFYCQERKFNDEDVAGVLEELESDDDLDGYGYTAAGIRANAPLMSEIVSAYEENRDEYNINWHDAAVDAVRDTLAEITVNNK